MKALFTYLKRQIVRLLPETAGAMIIDAQDTLIGGARDVGRGLLSLFVGLFTSLMVVLLFVGFPVAIVIVSLIYLVSPKYRNNVKVANEFAEKA